jgi:acyl-coenzyme A synthetase/AMP-(fatty) acid ligase
VRIVDEDEVPVAAGGTGELQVRTSNLMSGYHQALPPWEDAPGGSWFRTGDLARLTAGAQVVLIDRLGDLVKDSRGEFICTAEIEQALELHPAVLEAGVSPLRTPEGDVELAAFIVTKQSAPLSGELVEKLRHHLAERFLPSRVPNLFRKVGELPRGSNGKLLRREFTPMLHAQEGYHDSD